ncbi:P22AR C-terminal domain-containing protein [Citrobacter freundii]|uniref:P22AR C-terminal domain-containing protein n=1 Tax=Citrobacter freundii TaxID=546 RepID=UPI0023B0574A|nr:P22AR C-terminal domain-containing protein [Citrobacter freundii]
MVSKNSEARKCANTNRASMSVTVCKETNMSIVTKSDLNFQGIHLQPVENIDETWLTASQIGYALQYADDKAVQRIYSRHADEFTEKMTGVVKVTTPYGDQMTRAFSLRGAHLIAMFARTPKAKEFRCWVLDILDREVSNSPIAKQFSDEELCTLAYLWRSSAVMFEACKEVYPLLCVAEHRMAPRFGSIGTNYTRNINKARMLLQRETAHIEEHPWGDNNWKNVFSYGKGFLQ